MADTLLNAGRLTHVARMAYGYARVGRPQQAQRLYGELAEIAAGRPVGADHWILEQALAWLRRAADNPVIDDGQWNLMFVRENALFDAVLDRPEFAELRERLRFPSP